MNERTIIHCGEYDFFPFAVHIITDEVYGFLGKCGCKKRNPFASLEPAKRSFYKKSLPNDAGSKQKGGSPKRKLRKQSTQSKKGAI